MNSKCCAKTLIKEILKTSLKTFKERLEAQKLIYVAQEVFNVGFSYSFMWYSRGPYSKALARDLRVCDLPPIKECVSPAVLSMINSFVNDLRNLNTPLSKSLEIVASYLMLKKEVFPKPEDPVKELRIRKPYLKEGEIMEAIKVLNTYL